ncbi:DUF6894 family protein [Methylobacterium planeticum]|uniref:DUF6894 domain-containing protein n=1 Tax=Methylobacterium planeticum TaxID=2615211 RepID=A0A6N6MSG8_9HYPH|nr:hypothetical protein [Methylobacterium planeticum]KAB1074765.1 hypothetical protein F6X51_06490 [Methylobacterium planeticum]
MPRYFFDMLICGNPSQDLEGLVLEDDGAARIAAGEILHDLATASLPSGRSQVFVATVREHRRGPVFRTTMTLETETIGAVLSGV